MLVTGCGCFAFESLVWCLKNEAMLGCAMTMLPIDAFVFAQCHVLLSSTSAGMKNSGPVGCSIDMFSLVNYQNRL